MRRANAGVLGATRAGIVALAMAVAALSVSAHAWGTVVNLRGTSGSLEGTITKTSEAGIVLRVSRNGLDRDETIPWSEVRSIDGASAAGNDGGGAAKWLDAGQALWRGRTRALRGDWPLALEPLERAARAWQGSAPSADGLAAALALTQAYAQAERWGDALPFAFEAMRHMRAGIAVPEWLQGSAALVDASRCIPSAIAPMALSGDAAAAAAEKLRAFAAKEDSPLGQAAAIYAFILDGGAGAAGGGGSGGGGSGAARPNDESKHGLAFLALLRDARSDNAPARATARKNLVAARRTMPVWSDAWMRYALGASLGLEADSASRERGAILLLSVEAVDAAKQPALAAAARARASDITKQLAKSSGGSASSSTSPPAQSARPEDAVPREHADAVAAHLESLGLTGLLTTHLELQLDEALTDEDRANIVSRLAMLLAGQLENEPDAARRDALLARSSRIVDRFDAGSEPLRLVLLRSQHRAAQRVAEDRRAGRASDDAAGAAAAQFKALSRSFDTLAKRTDLARQATEAGISRASGLQAEVLAERSSQQEQVARSSQFFQAWALYYQAWLERDLKRDGWRDVALNSMSAFARLIEPGKAAIEPSEVSVDLRSNEGFASAVLGSGLVASIAQSGSTADAWLALLEAPGTHESVRTKLPAWRMASLLDRGEYTRALTLLHDEGDGPQGGAMALIAAARAARDPDTEGSAELLTEAVARIASAGRLADLAAMTGVAHTARTGAGGGLFEGVRLAARAQKVQQEGDAETAKRTWAEAATTLDAALKDGAPPAIVAGARALQGWALRGAGRLQEAADAFVASAKGSTGDRAGDSMWNAVLSLDEAARKGDSQAATRADAMVDQVIRDAPGTGAAVRAHAWRVVRTASPALADIDALLAPTVAAEMAPAARRAAFEGLYRRFRTLEGGDRLSAARRGLTVSDTDPVALGEDGTVQLRKRLELAIAVDDRSRAGEAMAGLEARTERNQALAQSLIEEMSARRAQMAALDRRASEALAAARTLEPATPWGRVGWRAACDAVLRDASSTLPQRAFVARAVVLGAADPSRVPTEDIVAWVTAESALLRSGVGDPALPGDPDGAQKALAAAREHAPRDADLGLADAELRWARGDRAGAEAALRTLMARIPVGTPAWFSGKVMQIQALAADDPSKARALLEQVRQLAGGLGEGAAGAELAALDKRLPKEAQ